MAETFHVKMLSENFLSMDTRERIGSKKMSLLIGLIFSLCVSGCLSQKDIETACLQTLSASTPVCSCKDSGGNPQVNETAASVEATEIGIAPQNLPSITETPEPPPTPQAEDFIFTDDFESGISSSFNGENGEYLGKGVFYRFQVVDKPAIGNRSAALTIGSGEATAAYLFTYKVPSTPLGYYSADFYIPDVITPGDWWNIWQWKSEDNTYSKPVISLDILKENGVFQLNMFYTPGGDEANPTENISKINPIDFPADRWVNITGYYMSTGDDSGYVIVFQDGVKIFEKRNIQTKPGNKNILWSVNSYADRISPDPATIYVDNMKIAEMR